MFLLLRIALYTADPIWLAVMRVMPLLLTQMKKKRESVTQEDAMCFATSSTASSPRVGNEATTSSTNTKDSEAEGTSTVSSVSRAGDTNVSCMFGV